MTLAAPLTLPPGLSAPVRSATVRELIALLASCEERLRALRHVTRADGPVDAAVDEARDDVLHLQGRVVGELRRRRRGGTTA